MKQQSISVQAVVFVLIGSIFLTSCASTTVIHCTQGEAKVYIDGEAVGKTPYRHRDSKIVGSTTTVQLEKEGYEPLLTSFSRDEEVDAGAIIGGIFVWVPFLWTMKYKATHIYELRPEASAQSFTEKAPPRPPLATPKSKTEKLRELKQLLDEKVITSAEYEKEKQKILTENE